MTLSRLYISASFYAAQQEKKQDERINTVAKYLTVGNYLTTIGLGQKDGAKIYEDIFASVFDARKPDHTPRIVETQDGEVTIRRGNWRQSIGE